MNASLPAFKNNHQYRNLANLILNVASHTSKRKEWIYKWNSKKFAASTIPFSQARSFSTNNNKSVKKIVYHSRSRNIYQNLAFEEWLFENTDLSKSDMLLVWQSDPCVVVGKHQNPWLESNVPILEKESVCLARRSSGGGTVYHDGGNLNLSFMKDKSRYDRKENLELVVKALTSRWDIDLSINERDDIVLDGVHKISGTAAKLTRNKSYHHFTLLHSVDRAKLSAMLSSPLKSKSDTQKTRKHVETRSTQSVPSPVANLCDGAPQMSFSQMTDAVITQFLAQSSSVSQPHIVYNLLDQSQYPGVTEICDRLQAWNWLYGKTPKFTVSMETLTKGNENRTDSVKKVSIVVEKGCLVSYLVTLNSGSKIDLAYVNNLTGLEMRRENVRLFTCADSLFGRNFVNAYPLLHAQSLTDSIRDCLPDLFDFL